MTETNAESVSRAGQVIGGKWRLTRRIGVGGMGEVYEAQHAVIGRRFAIKFLHPFLAQNPEAMTRFRHEAQAAGGIEHENIGAALDFGTADDGTPYLVMEYLDGEDLARLLVRTGPLAIPRAAYIIIQACRGLAAAHARGIVHRDLKPENLFVCKRVDGSDLVKVVDFGIAKLRTQATVTQSGMTMGTPCYMSLEQARGAKDVDQRTDIYALGVILYEAISGAKPYPGETYNEVLYNLFTSEPVPIASLRAGLDAGLSATVHRAMARDAGSRFNSVEELAEALVPHAGRPVTPLRSQVGLIARPEDDLERITTPAPVVQPSVDRTPAPAPITATPQMHEVAGTHAIIRSVIPSKTRRWMGAVVGAVILTGPLTYGTWLLFVRNQQVASPRAGASGPGGGGHPGAGFSTNVASVPPGATPAIQLPPVRGTAKASAGDGQSPTPVWTHSPSTGSGSGLAEGRIAGHSTTTGASDASGMPHPARPTARPGASKAAAAPGGDPRPPAKLADPETARKRDSRHVPTRKRTRSFDPYPEE